MSLVIDDGLIFALFFFCFRVKNETRFDTTSMNFNVEFQTRIFSFFDWKTIVIFLRIRQHPINLDGLEQTIDNEYVLLKL